MKVLCLGDVVGSAGCNALRDTLPQLLADKNIDFCLVNGENSADGNGILPTSAEHIFSSGADVITTGNHTFRRKEIYDYLDSHEFLLRPANYPKDTYGKGSCVYDMGRVKIGVINLLGVIYLNPLANPFEVADKYVENLEEQGCKIIIVDFHAEATAEKKALGYYLDGRVTAIVGTHTHTQTNDAQILPKGTGFITDLGMCGPKNSVLGVKPELAINKLKTGLPVRFENADGKCIINGCLMDIDERTGKCKKIEIISL